MNEIKLEKRYPHSRTEDITDAFIRGYEQGRTHWASVLAELHERFDALEKEIRKASAEMSAIIREYVGKGEREREGESQTDYVLSKDSDTYKFNKRMEVEEEWLNEQSGKE